MGLYLGMFVKEDLVGDNENLCKILAFACEIFENYLDNPYHSGLHAIDVTYSAYYILTGMGISAQIEMTDYEMAAILLAALGHDVLHPGMNNVFQVSSK